MVNYKSRGMVVQRHKPPFPKHQETSSLSSTKGIANSNKQLVAVNANIDLAKDFPPLELVTTTNLRQSGAIVHSAVKNINTCHPESIYSLIPTWVKTDRFAHFRQLEIIKTRPDSPYEIRQIKRSTASFLAVKKTPVSWKIRSTLNSKTQ